MWLICGWRERTRVLSGEYTGFNGKFFGEACRREDDKHCRFYNDFFFSGANSKSGSSSSRSRTTRERMQ